jgi:hypothetical protein
MSDEGLKRARYSEVERRLWNDARFRSLSPVPPCGAGLWLYLLTTPELGSLPGLIVMGESAMAEHLDWPLEAFREAFREVFSKGMAEADWKARLVVTFKAIGKHPPQSPNVIISWRPQWLEVPECDLKTKYYRAIKAYVEGLGEGFQKAFLKAIQDPSPNQYQEQEQEQEQQQSATVRAAAPAAVSTKPKPVSAVGGDLVAIETEIRRHAVFEHLDARAIAEVQDGRMMTSGQRLPWVIAAIEECAAKSVGLGLKTPELQAKLVGFMRHARRPKDPEPDQQALLASRRDTLPAAPKWTTEFDVPTHVRQAGGKQ